MTVKIISKLVKICSLIIFAKSFIVKISIIFVVIFSEQVSVPLIILKLIGKDALTIANSLPKFSAECGTALTDFFFSPFCEVWRMRQNCAFFR